MGSDPIFSLAYLNPRALRRAARAGDRAAGRAAGAAFMPLDLAQWETRARYGTSAAEQRIAREAWDSPALGCMRWFAEMPAFDGLGKGSTCAWFIDLRFANPGRDWLPFQYGACRDDPAAPWHAFERLGASGRRPLD